MSCSSSQRRLAACSTTTYSEDFNAVKALGRGTGSTRTPDQTALAPFWEGNASVHWNQAANQIARANHLSMSRNSRLLALLNMAMADTAITTWSAKRTTAACPPRSPGGPQPRSRWPIPTATRTRNWIRGGSRSSTRPPTRSIRPGIPSLNGAAATVLLSALRGRPGLHADDSRPAEPHLHEHRAGALGREQRPRLGRHALSQHRRDQRRRGRGDCHTTST